MVPAVQATLSASTEADGEKPQFWLVSAVVKPWRLQKTLAVSVLEQLQSFGFEVFGAVEE